MTDQGIATGPPIAMDRPLGQPVDLPKEANTRIVDLPKGKPRHDRPRTQPVPPPSPQKDQAPAAMEAPNTAKPEPATAPPVASDETSTNSKAPTRKVLAAGAGGGGIGVPLSVILGYYVLPPDTPPEVTAAMSGMLVAVLSFFLGYLTPPER